MKLSYLRAILFLCLIHLGCCPDIGRKIHTSFEYEAHPNHDFSYDVFIYNLEGERENGFLDGSSTIDRTIDGAKTKKTRKIELGETIYIRVPMSGYSGLPGINVRVEGVILVDAFQFFIMNDCVHYMMKVDGAIEFEHHPNGELIITKSQDGPIPIRKGHVVGHVCPPNPNGPPGQC